MSLLLFLAAIPLAILGLVILISGGWVLCGMVWLLMMFVLSKIEAALS